MNKLVFRFTHSNWLQGVFFALVIVAIVAIVLSALVKKLAAETPTVASTLTATAAPQPTTTIAPAAVNVTYDDAYCVTAGTGSSFGMYTVGAEVKVYYGVADSFSSLIVTDGKSWASEIGIFKNFTPWFSTAVKSNTESAPFETSALQIACLESGEDIEVGVGDIVYVSYTPMETPDFVRDDVYKNISLWLVTGAAPESWYHISNPEDLLSSRQAEFSCGPSRFIVSEPNYMKLVPITESVWSPLPYAINDDDLMYGGKIEYTPIGLQVMCGLDWKKPKDIRVEDDVNEIYLYKFTPGETWLWRQTIKINN